MAKGSSNMREERKTEARSGHISQLQHSQRESEGVVPPNGQHRLAQTEITSSGQATATALPPSLHISRGVGSIVIPIPSASLPNIVDSITRQAAGGSQTGFQYEHRPDPEPSSPPPPYKQREAPSVTSVQEGSRSRAGVPTEPRDEPKKLPGKKYPIFSSPPLNSLASSFCHP